MSTRVTADYLWDRSGEPDELLEHLESVLIEYRISNRFTPSDTEPEGREAPLDESGP